ncbi:Caleosin-domain-containing protein [Sporormia fimetaria CBS 119925]|uniref:Caleosin-domain-containing protein n=1 Tax=Sporormia fimetaria CBS 119925 TaxID=1340428 RepID=A0A6A6V9R3_9PLEO|nr:Caleosin-domain-containing protein [Sporormia fimetaria CBS 119925]
MPQINIFSPTIANVMPGTTIAGVAKEEEEAPHDSTQVQPEFQTALSTPYDMSSELDSMDKHTHLLQSASTSQSSPLIEEIDMSSPSTTTTTTTSNNKITTSIPTIPITHRKPFISPSTNPSTPNSPPILPHAGTARANLAPSVQSPNGTTANSWSERHSHQTVLQQHCAFFDPDSDGVIWPTDTYSGFRRLSFGILLSVIAVLIIHLNFSYPTQDTWVPDPFFRVYLANIHKDKHGSDTGTYDHSGRYVPQKFEEIFTKYGSGEQRDYLTIWDVGRMLRGQRCFGDPVGWMGAFFEWLATWLMLWPRDGRMRKEEVRRVFDGSLFEVLAERRGRERERARGGKGR